MRTLILLLLTLSMKNAIGQCCNGQLAYTTIVNINSTTPVNLGSCLISGLQYTKVSGIIEGIQYRITMIDEFGFHRYITVRSENPCGSVFAHGMSPFDWTASAAAAATGKVSLHYTNSVGCSSSIWCNDVTGMRLTPLPITIVQFDVQQDQSMNKIMWATAQEMNSEKQVVERSTDALTWVTIGQVESTNTPFKSHYEWVDSEPLPAAYYRIKNIDFDGKEQFSDIRYVRNTNLSEVNDLQILLLGDMLTLNLPNSFKSKPINFQIIDMMGRNIINENLFCNNENVIDFQLNEFIANHGIYIARVTCDGRSHELKFVK